MNRVTILPISAAMPLAAAEPLAIAAFQVDATPPLGSPLCGGQRPAARAVVDRLSARGIVLLGAQQPIVLVAVDWIGIGNEGLDAWRTGCRRPRGILQREGANFVAELQEQALPGIAMETG